jgi:hypothetical protein
MVPTTTHFAGMSLSVGSFEACSRAAAEEALKAPRRERAIEDLIENSV